jgi:peroxiredoxin
MQAWGYDQKIGGSMINFMADPIGELTAALDMKMTSPGPPSIGLVNRCKRFAMHVVDGEVKYFAVSESENDPAGDDDPTTSSAPAMLDAVKAAV